MIYVLIGINFTPESRNSEFFNISNIDASQTDTQDATTFVGPRMWQPCNDGIDSSMRKDHPISTVPALDYVLNEIK
jgi:hypothetical protein